MSDQLNAANRWLTPNDFERSATTTHMGDLVRALEPLGPSKLNNLLDIGCGYGGLSRFIADRLGITDVDGIDIDESVFEEALRKGVNTHHVDVSHEALPFPDNHFDLVVSLGMMDYLPTFDGLIREIHRVLRPGGYTLIALPNLASWHNRFLLLFGYQPRDVEISGETVTGIFRRWYSDDEVTGHIHTSTVAAFSELMDFHGIQQVRVTSGRPMRQSMNVAVDLADRLLSRRVTLARRFFYLGRKLADGG